VQAKGEAQRQRPCTPPHHHHILMPEPAPPPQRRALPNPNPAVHTLEEGEPATSRQGVGGPPPSLMPLTHPSLLPCTPAADVAAAPAAGEGHAAPLPGRVGRGPPPRARMLTRTPPSCLAPPLQTSLLHLQQVIAMLHRFPAETDEALRLVRAAEQQLVRIFSGLGVGAQHMLRQTLQRFFLERRIKVSLFLLVGVGSCCSCGALMQAAQLDVVPAPAGGCGRLLLLRCANAGGTAGCRPCSCWWVWAAAAAAVR